MSHDTSHEVRLSTLNGTMRLFGNPPCHQFLNVLLPRLGHLMMDNVLSIRVVKLDELLSTLENDQPQVAQKIARLLMPSYFPSKETVETACNRCTTIVKRSLMAGARFCEFAASQGASLKSLMELVRQSKVRSAHNLLLSCDAIDGMLEALTALLQKSAYRCHIKYGSEIKNLSVFSAKRRKSKSSGKVSARHKHVSRKKVTSFGEDYSVAAGIAWQIRDSLVSVNIQKAILGSQTLESLLILKVISEVSILACIMNVWTHFLLQHIQILRCIHLFKMSLPIKMIGLIHQGLLWRPSWNRH
ncbi:hypothetical protein RchiOBHm_Chr2g0138441 [Rosa chinensis]|uniref:Uncharacterized protein n=1 Tax=Rosa chinensis TaxID=74649 RepID=A0A2P6RWV5_ROSCH|nr:hypothetical protein RchiOBHm_Chr2g0138441 [Rosa chinensis]